MCTQEFFKSLPIVLSWIANYYSTIQNGSYSVHFLDISKQRRNIGCFWRAFMLPW